ncbi:1-acyl-sn-glycerol-3-phosphate acyltransferase [Prolixibacter denitrificans]|uniref:Glycerol acyltransferase n=1 Tax=Prolixibacter denitrificans TaxID=1541063 RepID=A0A2P8CIK2_9BACT|nr:1-acyl-sn-glycerol-3-phosphate acyltransferase [Prolixibacter denitrificans]PSK84762.1 putative hemolysin [Prolixibacter denitrificans]GET20927.1 glycerol acyltransferase [Prolixibacter denitrificans]
MEQREPVQKLKPIVLKELIADKSPKLASRIPGFVYRYLNYKLHIKEVNQIIRDYGHLTGVEFCDAVISDFKIKFDFHGLNNLPGEGRYIFASNHPLGGFDGLLLLSQVTHQMGPSKFLVRDELTKIPPLAPVFVPINKHGSQRKAAKVIQDAYESDNQILIFPSGLASRRINGKVVDLAWHKHFIQKSIQYQRDVIPVHISGRNSGFFYRFANFRKFIGLKFNIEMFFLPDETFKQRGKEVSITFGEPISWQTFSKEKSQNNWAAWVKSKVYDMAPSTQK